jgi:lipid-A-disaccharide synthase-like uncharacterized protein
MSTVLIYSMGFLAQVFFSVRILTQWILSEHYKRVVSPNIYWIFSLIGSVLLFIYGILRNDFSIILGQFMSYYIYIWNLNIKEIWKKISCWIKIPILILPVFALCYLLHDVESFFIGFLQNEKVPLTLLLFGSAGQLIFSMRFIYQWYQSYRLQRSILPLGFWIISLVGSGIIIIYGIIRLDPVLIIGQSFGFVAYIRNMIIYKNHKRT